MTNNLKRQVEVQGTKKLDSVKGVQTLELKEIKTIEGGIAPWLAFVGGVMVGHYLGEAIDSFIEGVLQGMEKNRGK